MGDSTEEEEAAAAPAAEAPAAEAPPPAASRDPNASVIDARLLSTIVSSPLDAASLGESGTFEFRSGNTYEGGIAGGTTMHGDGAYRWADTGVTYRGQFSSNELSGAGTYEWPDGSRYEGEVRGGVRHGSGLFVGPAGFPRYDGQWHEGRRHGVGKLEYEAGGDVYEGEWVADVRHGHGRLTHASGNVYEGAWADDAKNGRGTFHWSERGGATDAARASRSRSRSP